MVTTTSRQGEVKMDFVTASAPGKCILFGEHAVVYGCPAVAVAIEQRISVKLQPSQTNTWLLNGNILNLEKNPHISGLIEKLWPVKEGAPPLSIQIEGNIPPASGLGSSAALSVATAAALRRARGRWIIQANNTEHTSWAEGFSSKISQTDAYSSEDGFFFTENHDNLIHLIDNTAVDLDECAILAHSVEAAAQNGRASPMDSSTCAHGGVVIISDVIEESVDYIYSRELKVNDDNRQWHIHHINPNSTDDVYLVIGNTGVHAPTGKQVSKVAMMLEKEPSRMKEIEAIGKIARRGIQALLDSDYEMVGKTMIENQIMLTQIGVSSPELDVLIKAATPTSIGVKLTGAGGGGCMVALTRNPKLTSEAIELAGGRTLISKLGAQGITIDYAPKNPLWSSHKFS